MRSLWALVLVALAPQDKKDAPPPDPKVLFFSPLAVKPGETAKVVARGLSLDKAESIAGGEIKIKSKGKAAVPANADPLVYGDTQIEFEIKVPAEAAEGALSLVVATPAGKAPAHGLLVVPGLFAEKEQNGGFASAQPVEAGQRVLGAVGAAKDVDVFRVKGKAGERRTFEVLASRHGSVLDPSLSVHDASGRLLAAQDDGAGSRDPSLTVTLPADGVCYVSLIDAHDQGGDKTHPYLLMIK